MNNYGLNWEYVHNIFQGLQTRLDNYWPVKPKVLFISIKIRSFNCSLCKQVDLRMLTIRQELNKDSLLSDTSKSSVEQCQPMLLP